MNINEYRNERMHYTINELLSPIDEKINNISKDIKEVHPNLYIAFDHNTLLLKIQLDNKLAFTIGKIDFNFGACLKSSLSSRNFDYISNSKWKKEIEQVFEKIEKSQGLKKKLQKSAKKCDKREPPGYTF